MQALVRKALWRAGRKMYCWARQDLANNSETNGEYWLLNEVVRLSADAASLLDVGANQGEWSLRAASLAQRAARPVSIYAFEPCSGTRSILQTRISGVPNIEICPLAMSSAEGEADFFSSGAGKGTNSLSSASGANAERVSLSTVDLFAERKGLSRIDMLKVDTEGFDFGVLQGASRLLSEGRIECVQFEYNWRWLFNRASLLDVFKLVAGMPYRLGKLTADSIEFYEEWHFELDRFFENNYVLIRKGSRLEQKGRAVRFDGSNSPQLSTSWR